MHRRRYEGGTVGRHKRTRTTRWDQWALLILPAPLVLHSEAVQHNERQFIPTASVPCLANVVTAACRAGRPQQRLPGNPTHRASHSTPANPKAFRNTGRHTLITRSLPKRESSPICIKHDDVLPSHVTYKSALGLLA